MASYLAGVTDIFPQLDQFQPNLQLTAQALQTRQQSYNAGESALKSLYSSLFNAPVSSADNVRFRNEFFKKAGDAFNKAARTDLSKAENIRKAQDILAPLTTDSDLVIDISKTRQMKLERQKLDAAKYSSDEKIREGFSPIAEQHLSNAEERLRTSRRGDGSIAASKVNKFTIFTDADKYLSEQAAKENLKIERDSVSGLYKMTSTDGAQAVEPYEIWANRHLTNGRFSEQWKVMSEVARDNKIRGYKQLMPNASEADLNKLFIQDSYETLAVDYEDKQKALEKNVTVLEENLRGFNSKHGGKIPKDKVKEISDLKARWRQATKDRDAFSQQVPSIQAQNEKILANLNLNPGVALSSFYQNQAAHEWAKSYARTHEKVKIEADAAAIHVDSELNQNARQQRGIATDFKKMYAENDFRVRAATVAHGRNIEMANLNNKNAMNREVFKSTLEFQLKNGLDGGMINGASTYTGQPTSQHQVYDEYQDKLNSEVTNKLSADNVFKIAGHLAVNPKTGESLEPNVSFVRIKMLMEKAHAGVTNPKIALNNDERKELSKYLERVKPGSSYTDYYSAVNLIGYGLGKYGKLPQYENMRGVIDDYHDGQASLVTSSKLHNQQQQILANKWKEGGDYQKSILNVNGTYVINPAYANDPAVQSWVPNSSILTKFTATRNRELLSNIPTKDTSPVLLTGMFSQGVQYGTSTPNGTQWFGGDVSNSLKNALGAAGTANMGKVIDMQGARFYKQTEGKQTYLQIDAGVLRGGENNKQSMIDGYLGDADARKSVNASNRITMRIPIENLSQLTSGNREFNVMGQSFTIPDNVGRQLDQLMQREELPISPLTGIEDMSPGKRVPLPSALNVYGLQGSITKLANGYGVQIRKDKGAPIEDTLPNMSGEELYRVLQKMGKSEFASDSAGKKERLNKRQESHKAHKNQYGSMSDEFPELFPKAN